MLKSETRIFYLLLSIITILFCVVAANTDGNGGFGDSICHYLIARGAWHNPVMFLDHWGKPLYTLLSAPFAHIGITAVKCFNIVVSSIACALTFHTALRLNIKNAAWVMAFYFLASEFYEVTFTAFTEPVFALFFALGIYLLSAQKTMLGTCVLSFLPLARSEGLIILCVLFVYLLYLGKFRFIPLLLLGHLVFGVAGMFIYHDILWVFNRIPYLTLKPVYGSGPWYHFTRSLYYIFGPTTSVCMLAGLFVPLLQVVRNAAETVTTGCDGAAMEVDVDIVPMREVVRDALVRLGIGARQTLQCRVREDHAPAERVVGAVALQHYDVVRRIRLLEQQGEIESGRTGADHSDLHARASPC